MKAPRSAGSGVSGGRERFWRRPALDRPHERPGHHEAIIDGPTYNASLIGAKTRFHLGQRPKPHRLYLLKGVISCENGHPMHGDATAPRAFPALTQRRHLQTVSPLPRSRCARSGVSRGPDDRGKR